MADEFLEMTAADMVKRKPVRPPKIKTLEKPQGIVQTQPIVQGIVRYSHDGRKLLSPYAYLPGQQGYRPKKGDSWINLCSRLKKEMMAAVEDTVHGDLRAYLQSIAEREPAKYLTILASLLPKQQDIDIGVKHSMAAHIEQMPDEDLLKLAMATGLDLAEVEQTGETDEQARGAEAERILGEDGEDRPNTEGLCTADATVP